MKTKRIAALGLAALMTGSLLTGCGGSTSSSTSAASASGNTDTAASASASADLSSTSSVPTSTTASSATTTEGKKASDIKVAGMIYLEDNFMKMLAAGFKAAAQDAGVNYTEFNCNQDQAAESETIATYASQGMDGIAIAPLNEDSSSDFLRCSQ
jgi:ABC-type sugar transport system substrate-binding protein